MSQSAENPAIGAGLDDGDLSTFKDYLSQQRFRIRLDDQVNATVSRVLARMSGEEFPLSTATSSGEDFVARLAAYEEAVRPLQAKATLLGKWATSDQLPTLTSMLVRISQHRADVQSGQSLWLDLRLYPMSLLLYSVGIASLAAENYRAFAAAHSKRIDARTRRSRNGAAIIIVPVIDAMADVANTNVWRHVEEYKQKRVPGSEYLFNTLRPALEDLLFLGASYEHLFDRYEILRALIYADAMDDGWGPVGRFAWKFCQDGEDNPYATALSEAAQQKDAWGPLQAGLFRSSHARFNEVATRFKKEVLQRLQWF